MPLLTSTWCTKPGHAKTKSTLTMPLSRNYRINSKQLQSAFRGGCELMRAGNQTAESPDVTRETPGKTQTTDLRSIKRSERNTRRRFSVMQKPPLDLPFVINERWAIRTLRCLEGARNTRVNHENCWGHIQVRLIIRHIVSAGHKGSCKNETNSNLAHEEGHENHHVIDRTLTKICCN